jgi:hypothetical protein
LAKFRLSIAEHPGASIYRPKGRDSWFFAGLISAEKSFVFSAPEADQSG